MNNDFNRIIQRLRYELTLAANLDRQNKAQKLIDYYNGKQLDYLDNALAVQFTNPESLKYQPAVDNITQFIGDEISRVFDSPPVLTCENATGQALLDEQLSDGTLQLQFKICEVYANLTTICALHPWWSPDEQRIKNTIIPNYSLFVSQRESEPTEIDCVTYTETYQDTVSAQEYTRYVHWDDTYNFYFTDDSPGRYFAPDPENNPEMLNPYGLIPFAFMRDMIPVGKFFNDIGEQLINAQETLNVRLTEINQLIKFQGFSIPVLLGMEDPNTPIIVDPSRPLKIPKNTRDETQPDFKFVSPGGELSKLLDSVDRLVEQVTSRFGISSVALKAQAQMLSGYAMKIANQRLDRRRDDCIPLARAFLLQWWQVVKRINNVQRPQAQVPEDAGLNIDFVEPTYQEDPANVNKRDAEEIEMGIKSPVDVLMERNPDITEEEARARYEQNLRYLNDIKRRYGLQSILGGGNSDQ